MTENIFEVTTDEWRAAGIPVGTRLTIDCRPPEYGELTLLRVRGHLILALWLREPDKLVLVQPHRRIRIQKLGSIRIYGVVQRPYNLSSFLQ